MTDNYLSKRPIVLLTAVFDAFVIDGSVAVIIVYSSLPLPSFRSRIILSFNLLLLKTNDTHSVNCGSQYSTHSISLKVRT